MKAIVIRALPMNCLRGDQISCLRFSFSLLNSLQDVALAQACQLVSSFDADVSYNECATEVERGVRLVKLDKCSAQLGVTDGRRVEEATIMQDCGELREMH